MRNTSRVQRICLLCDSQWKNLNRTLFRDSLPRPAIHVTDESGMWGACNGQLHPVSGDPVVESVLLSRNLFQEAHSFAEHLHATRIILAHEMIHVWQWMIDGMERIRRDDVPETGHGTNFFSWKPAFDQQRIILKEGYSAADLFGPAWMTPLYEGVERRLQS